MLQGRSAYLLQLVYAIRQLPENNKLTTLDWEYEKRPSPAEVNWVIEQVAGHCNPVVLRSLKLKIDPALYHAHWEDDDTGIDQVVLGPLRALRELREIHLDFARSILITPATLAKIPVSWPRLEFLALEVEVADVRPPMVNHTHVLELATRLPSLRRWGLRFDATRVTPQDVNTDLQRPTPKLEVLRVGNSPICSHTTVLAFLKKSFPRLRNITHFCIPGGRCSDCSIIGKRWCYVDQRLQRSL